MSCASHYQYCLWVFRLPVYSVHNKSRCSTRFRPLSEANSEETLSHVPYCRTITSVAPSYQRTSPLRTGYDTTDAIAHRSGPHDTLQQHRLATLLSIESCQSQRRQTRRHTTTPCRFNSTSSSLILLAHGTSDARERVAVVGTQQQQCCRDRDASPGAPTRTVRVRRFCS